MISYNSIKNFRTRLSDLLKTKRGVYSNLPDEIKLEFEESDIEKIRNNRDMILIQSEAIIVKLRLPDRRMQLKNINFKEMDFVQEKLYFCKLKKSQNINKLICLWYKSVIRCAHFKILGKALEAES